MAQLAARFGLLPLLLWLLASAPAAAQIKPPDLLEKLRCGAPSVQSAKTPGPLREIIPRRTAPLPRRILAIGSSSTAGAGSKGGGYPALLQVELNRRRGGGAPITVTAKGVFGERAGGALARLRRLLKIEKPDLLIWQVGTNDALERVPLQALRETIEIGAAMVREQAIPLILVDPQYFPKIRDNAHYSGAVALIGRVAEEFDLRVAKRYARMRSAEKFGLGAIRALLARDQFHMSGAGHACLALDLAELILPKRRR